MTVTTKRFLVLSRSPFCLYCGRELSDPDSQAIGIGPECIRTINIDREAVVKALSAPGSTYNLEYEETDKMAIRFHQVISERRLIDIDKDLVTLLALKDKLNSETILKRLESYTLSFEENTELSETRGLALQKKLEVIKQHLIKEIGKFPYRLDDVKSEVELAMKKLVSVIEIEQRYNSVIRNLYSLKSKKTGKNLFGASDEIHRLKMWCSGFKNGSISSRELHRFLSLKEIEAGISEETLKEGIPARQILLITERTKALENKEADDKIKILKKREDDIHTVLLAVKEGNIGAVVNTAKRNSQDREEILGYVTSHREELFTEYENVLLHKIKDRKWSEICSDVDDLIYLGEVIDGKGSQDLLLNKILSIPACIEELNIAVKSEGRDWSPGLRRMYGKLMGYNVWGVAMGTKKIKEV